MKGTEWRRPPPISPNSAQFAVLSVRANSANVGLSPTSRSSATMAVHYPEKMRLRLPRGMPEALALAAEHHHTTPSEWARQALLRSLQADGVCHPRWSRRLAIITPGRSPQLGSCTRNGRRHQQRTRDATGGRYAGVAGRARSGTPQQEATPASAAGRRHRNCRSKASRHARQRWHWV